MLIIICNYTDFEYLVSHYIIRTYFIKALTHLKKHFTGVEKNKT